MISTTGEHPFWVADKGWVEAKDLIVGSLLQTADGRVVDVDKVEKREGKVEVYNLKVEGIPTYYVSELGILVHNANCPPLTPPPNPTNPISMDDAVSLGAQHVGDGGQIGISGSGGYQFISSGVDAQGNNIARVARFDINPNSPHVQQAGPHLNLETQINGRPVRNGPLADPHIPIDPNTITQTGDIP